jgi:hypothetical protein
LRRAARPERKEIPTVPTTDDHQKRKRFASRYGLIRPPRRSLADTRRSAWATAPIASTGHSPSAQAFGADGAAHGATSQAVSTAIAELGVRRTTAQQARIALAGNLTAGTVNDARDARDRLTQQIQTVENNYLAYRAIPYEADAHEVGDSTTEAFLNP